MGKSIAFLSLGTNLGNKVANILGAIKLIQGRIGNVISLSDFIITDPWGFESENRFMNAVISISTDFSPLELLKLTQQIERELGRTSKSVNGEYHDRVIDIDILLYDDIRINTPELTVPHPFMQQREFVMKPLRQCRERCC
ncbi:MAG: 2-amino-4-hydroxy-6-hydroxymethyldihydropteridine diphosphokinase [Bacteroidaceae bacterium]|nr:2-amino-4-hydroxy-6-hydroxymethyldihydropteridine diphosphokinase [Bacteroidaceae bacterium]